MNEVKFSDLIGKVIKEITGAIKHSDKILITLEDGTKYRMKHYQDCCESVLVEEIIGDINDIIGEVIIEAEEVTSNENPEGIKEYYQESFTWTFYKLGTKKGFVNIRWYGESNGYYSQDVSFELTYI